MAEVHTEPVNWQATGVKNHFPWEQWFDGQVWKLDPQEDFNLEPGAPIETARRWVYQAKDRAVKAGTVSAVRTATLTADGPDGRPVTRLLVQAVLT
jgi:hypothetical protein